MMLYWFEMLNVAFFLGWIIQGKSCIFVLDSVHQWLHAGFDLAPQIRDF